jgi:ubiquinone/menaquinone biosynthesis C-methylase UbiE
MAVSEQEQNISATFDARKYADNHKKYAKLMYGGLVKRINSYGKAGRYLEIGAGPGFLTTMLAQANPNITITAIDILPEMAEVAIEHIKANKLEERIRYLTGDVADEKYMEGLGVFDFVYSSYSLHEWKEPEKSIRNLWRAVGVNGILYIYDFKKQGWLRFLPFKSGEKDAMIATPSARKIRAILQGTGVTDYEVKTSFPFLHQTVIARK